MKRTILSTAIIALSLAAAPAVTAQASCPPGLAKKSPACIPPGQAKKMRGYDEDRYEGRDRYRDRDDYARDADGDRIRYEDVWIDRNGYVRLDNYDGYRVGDTYVDEDGYIRVDDRYRDRYRLPRLERGEGWYRDGNVVVRVDEDTQRIIEIVRLSQLVLGN